MTVSNPALRVRGVKSMNRSLLGVSALALSLFASATLASSGTVTQLSGTLSVRKAGGAANADSEAIGRLAALRKTGHLIAAKIEELKQSIEQGAERTIGLRADEMVAGKYSDASGRSPPRQMHQPEEDARTRIQVGRLHEDVG